MKYDHTERIAALLSLQQPVTPTDSMAEAGRKVLLGEFIAMLQHEAGSRTGADIEDVHIMRVSTRRMRSAFRVLRPYFKKKAIRPFMEQLREIAGALGMVRDLDVLIADLSQFQTTLDHTGQSALQAVIAELDEHRSAARDDLNALFDSKRYARFIKQFAGFLTEPGEGALRITGKRTAPYQVRHILPILTAQQLVAVRAYDTILPDTDIEHLHALRIEVKRLRYLLSLFDDILGGSIKEFITELKVLQDHLGRLNDIRMARYRLDIRLDDLDNVLPGVLEEYLAALEHESPALLAAFPEVWLHFNSRKVQEKLSSALLVLR